MESLRILIADDHDLIRRGVRDLLTTRRGWEVAGEAANGFEAVQQAIRLRPQIVILDFSMPQMNGPEASAQITGRLPDTGVIVLTMHDSEEVIHEVLRSGARGLILKSDADRMLLGAVEAVAEKRHFFTNRASNLLMGGYLDRAAAGRIDKTDIPCLTVREGEVMRLLANGLTSKEVASSLQISTRTVETHRININRKFGFRSVAELVRYAIRSGIVSHA